MTEAYLSPQLIAFINYFYSFISKRKPYIEMEITIRDTGINTPFKELQIILREGRYNVCKFYNISNDPNALWDTDYAEYEASSLLNKLLIKEKEDPFNGKIET